MVTTLQNEENVFFFRKKIGKIEISPYNAYNMVLFLENDFFRPKLGGFAKYKVLKFGKIAILRKNSFSKKDASSVVRLTNLLGGEHASGDRLSCFL